MVAWARRVRNVSNPDTLRGRKLLFLCNQDFSFRTPKTTRVFRNTGLGKGNISYLAFDESPTIVRLGVTSDEAASEASSDIGPQPVARFLGR
jgi:hypothetical protein